MYRVLYKECCYGTKMNRQGQGTERVKVDVEQHLRNNFTETYQNNFEGTCLRILLFPFV